MGAQARPMAGQKGEKVVGRKGEEAMGKVQMGVLTEEKGGIAKQRVDEKQVTVVGRLTAIEEGTEEEEELEKERVVARNIGKKKGRDHLEAWWFKSDSFLEKGVMSATEVGKRGMEMPKDVANEEIILFFSASEKMITLTSSDEKRFKMPEAAARLSSILADMIDDKGLASDNIPLPHVPSHSLVVVIKYCNKHAAATATKPNADHNAIDNSTMGNTATSEELLEEWDQELVDSLTIDDLFDLIKTANFLDIKDLQDITCQKIANMIKGKSPEQLHETFHVANDFSEEEEEEMRKKISWAFPGDN